MRIRGADAGNLLVLYKSHVPGILQGLAKMWWRKYANQKVTRYYVKNEAVM